MQTSLQIGDVVLAYTSKYGGNHSIGLIKYIGSIRSDDCDVMTQYVGIELVEPESTGKGHNGRIDGTQYFQCKESYGIHVPITNVIQIMQSHEIMFKLQEIIEMFKHKLSEYIQALGQRDSYISDLIVTQKKQNTKIISLTTAKRTHSAQQSMEFSPKTAPLTPIADSTNMYKTAANNKQISYEQMMHNVDSAITAQSLAIKLDAKRVNNDYAAMRYRTPLTLKSKSSQNYSPLTATDTLATDSPSSMTPAPNTLKNINNTSQSTVTTKKTTVLHSDTGSTPLVDESDHISNSSEPDPLMTPSMDPIAETHSFGNNGSNQNPNWIRHNTMNTTPHSPVSGNSPHTPHNAHMIYYPEYEHIHDENMSTSSYYSPTANSSTFNTPKSTTVSVNRNAHGLLATWNANRKLSKQSSRSRSGNDTVDKGQIPRIKSRENSAKKRGHKTKKNVPHIYIGANTPTLSASNDAILSGKAFEVLPKVLPSENTILSVPNKKQRAAYNKNNHNKIHRSTSLIFTPSQTERKKYSFTTIHEEPSVSDADTPRFSVHHSTPIYHASQGSQQQSVDMHNMNMYYPNRNGGDIVEDDTPELPPFDGQPNFYQRQSMPGQQRTANMLQSRNINTIHRGSDTQLHQNHQSGNSKHMQASSQINIAVPNFVFNGDMPTHNTHMQQWQSLQNIHEHHKHNIHMQQQQQRQQYQNGMQLEHMFENRNGQMQQRRPLTAPVYRNPHPQPQQQQQQQQMQYANGGIEMAVSDMPMMNHSKSMPAQSQRSFHMPSQQSIDMNPYIDGQFIILQNSDGQGMDGLIEGVPIGPPVRNQNRSHSPLNGPLPPSHGSGANNGMTYSVHSGTQTTHTSSPQQSSTNGGGSIVPPNINTKIGKVQFAPRRKSITKQMRRMSKNSQRVQHISKNNKHSQHSNKQSQPIKVVKAPPNMNGFTLTDAMYD